MTVSAETVITDLGADDHACLTFGEREELLDLTAAFTRDGLVAGLRVMLVTQAPGQAVTRLAWRGMAAEAAVADGQLAVTDGQDGLLAGSAFSAGHAMGWLRDQLALSLRKGHAGLRVALDMGWALQPMTGIEELPALEEMIAAAVGGAGLSALCAYDRDRFDPVTLASVTPWHSHSVAAPTYHADPVLRICRQYVPPGIRLAGELDFVAAESLAVALGEAIRMEGDVTVNMAALRFIDRSCARMVIDAARSLGEDRAVVLVCHPEVRGVFAHLDAASLPRLSLVTADDW